MGTTSTPTFEVRDGEDWVTWTTSHGDTTSDKASRVKERPEEWAIAGPAYDAWKADAKAQKEAKAADEAKTKEADEAKASEAKVHAEPESVRAEKAKAEAKTKESAPESLVPEDDDDDDDDDGKAESKAGAAKMRAPFKGYRK